jgi:hypothetical protein
MMAYACNPSYLGDRDQEDGDSRPSRKKVRETTSQPIKSRCGDACLSSQLVWKNN